MSRRRYWHDVLDPFYLALFATFCVGLVLGAAIAVYT